MSEGSDSIVLSAVTGFGVDRLRRAIAERLAERAVSLSADALALHPRHEAAMRAASAHLAEAAALIDDTDHGALPAPELIAAALRAALDEIAALAGEITPDEILGRIFATFCVGK